MIRHTATIAVFAAVVLCAILPAFSATWSAGGFSGARPAGIQAQSNGNFFIGLQHSEPTSKVEIVQCTPASNKSLSVLSLETASDVEAMSPNGFVLLRFGDHFTVHSPSNAVPVDTFTLATNAINSVCYKFIPGKEILIAYNDNSDGRSHAIMRRNTETGTTSLLYIESQYNVSYNGLALSPDGSTLGAATHDGQKNIVETWNTSTGEHKVFPLDATVLHPPSLFAINSECAVYIESTSTTPSAPVAVNLANGNTMRFGQPILVQQISLLADNTCVVVAAGTSVGNQFGFECEVQLWNLKAQKPPVAFSFFVATGCFVQALQLSGNTLGVLLYHTICFERYASANFYDTKTGRLTAFYSNSGHVEPITATVWSPDGRVIASAGADGRTMWHNAILGRLMGDVPGTGHLAFGSTTMLLRASGTTIDKIDLATKTITGSKDIGVGAITALHRSPDGAVIAAVTASSITLLSYPDLSVLRTLSCPLLPGTVQGVAFTTTGSLVALISTLAPGQPAPTVGVAVWASSTGVLLSTTAVAGLGESISQCTLSPDGRSMVLWHTTTPTVQGAIYSTDGALLRTISVGNSYTKVEGFSTAFSHDGSSLYMVSEEIYGKESSLKPRQIIRRIEVHTSASDIVGVITPAARAAAISLSPDNQAIAYGFENGCLQGVLETAPLAPLPTLIAADAIDFGEVYSGHTEQRTIELTTDAAPSTPLIIKYISLSGALIERGVSVQYSRPLPDTVQPGEKRSFTITLAPNIPHDPQANGYIGLLTIGVANTYNTETFIEVYGKTFGTTLASDITAIDFGDVPVGTTAERTLLLFPGNAATLTIYDTFLNYLGGQTDGFSFGLSRELPATLADSSLKVTLRYTPIRAETRELQLVAASNDIAEQERVIPITARGIAAVGVAERGNTHTAHIAPNPLSSIARIRCTTTLPGPLTAQLFATDGRLVATVLNIQSLGAGTHDESFSVESLPAGVYFCRITTHAGTTVQPVVVRP